MQLRSIVLYFDHVPYPHDSVTISNLITSVMETYDRKVIALTCDNASVNNSAMELLVQSNHLDEIFGVGFIHFRCVAHIINLAVGDALKKVKPSIKDIHELVLSVRSSTKRTETFVALQRHMIDQNEGSLPNIPLNLKESVDTRWNRTYLMLERVFVLKDAVCQALVIIPEL